MALAAWGFRPQPLADFEPAPALCVLVVDASDSAQRRQQAWLPWMRELLQREALAAQARGEDLAVIAFAGDVGLVFGPGDPERFLAGLRGEAGVPLDPRSSAGARERSELAQALALASSLAAAPERLPGRVVLAGCDGYTGASPAAWFASLRRDGVQLELRALEPPYWHDLELQELRVAPRVELGAPLLALARIRHLPGQAPLGRAYLELEIQNGSLLQSKRLELELTPQGGEQELPIACGPAGPGRTQIEARLRLLPSPGDVIPENDSCIAYTRAEGAKPILVVAQAEQLEAARSWLTLAGESRLAGLQFAFSTPDALVRFLPDVEALVVYDLPLNKLPALPIEAFVQAGGGLLVTSGGHFLSHWSHGMPAGGLAGLLPAAPKPRDATPREVVLLVDGSGSMSGEPFDIVRSACLDLVESSAPEDRVVLRFFTVVLHAENVIKQRTSAAELPLDSGQLAAQRLLELHVPSGSTHILESIEQFAREPQEEAKETLLFVLTDGIELDAIRFVEQRMRELHAQLAAAGIQIVPIAIGAKHDLEFLQLLARPGQRVAQPEGLEALRELFEREISSDRWRDGDALELQWASPESGALVRELRGLQPVELTPIQRLIRNQLKPWGQALWLADEGEPVLSVGQVGRGRVALLASLPGEGWAPAWAGRTGFGQPAEFENLLRWLARKQAGAPSDLRLHQSGRELELRGLGSDWPARIGARVVDAIAAREVSFEELEFRPLERGGFLDFRARRQARLKSSAEVLASGAPILLLEDPLGQTRWLPLEFPRALEFSEHAPLPAAWLEQEPSGLESVRKVLEQGIDPRAPYWLALGLLALFLGFVERPR